MGWRYTKNGNVSRIQHCKDCGGRVEPIHSDGRNTEYWIWQICEGYYAHWIPDSAGCGTPVCGDCSEKIEENPEDRLSDSERICNSCSWLNAHAESVREKSAQ